MKRYFQVWWHFTSASFQIFFTSRIGAVLFLLGKVLRFIFFISFLVILVSKTQVMAGYSIWHILLFFLTFNLIDSITQMLFREVYRFRQQIVSGNFDLVLTKPVSPLFRSLFGWTDLLDFATLLPFIVSLIFVSLHIPDISGIGIIYYFILVLNALWIAASFHIMVLALAILTTEIDHAIMIYRDITSMGKFPIDIYSEPLRSLVTFAIPVGVMMTFPVKALLGVINIYGVIIALSLGLMFFVVSISLWKYALIKYTSASS